MKIRKETLKRIIKEEFDALQQEASGEYHSGGMEPFMANASVPTASAGLQASIDSLRETPAFKDSMTYLNHLNRSQTRDEAALELGRSIRSLRNSVEEQYKQLVNLSKKANNMNQK
jgi:hypothetical protein